MGMIGSAAIERIDLVAFLFNQISEIAVGPRLGELLVRFFGHRVVHIAQRDDLKPLLRTALYLAMTDSTDTDPRYRRRLTRGAKTGTAEYGPGNQCASGGRCGGPHRLPARDFHLPRTIEIFHIGNPFLLQKKIGWDHHGDRSYILKRNQK
jgi:hypothetical protein